MSILHRLADGSVEIRESFNLSPFNTETDREAFVLAMTEAVGEGKHTKLEAKIAAMPEGITRNKTFYPIDELEKSLESWTSPYPCPVIKDHNEYEVDGIVGRINEAYIAPDGDVNALWFSVSIIDQEAQEKVASGLWSQVSIGTRVGSAKCSVCGNDWATGTWCEHERGNYYLKDETNPDSAVQCFWIMSDIGGREVSFVTTPSAAKAGVRAFDQAAASESELEDSQRVIYSMSLLKADENELDQLRAVEYFGSPSLTGEATVLSSEKEESMEKPEVVETEETTEVVETEELSDASTKDEESVESTEDEGTQVDGQGDESKEETDEEKSEETEETEAEAKETEETDDTTSEDETDLESSETNEEAEATDEEAKVEDAAEGERSELLARIAGLEADVLILKAQLYVESGLRDGFLNGERDALVDTHKSMAESTLDELIDSVRTRRASVGSISEEILKHQVASPAAKIDDDDAADEADSGYTVSVRTGEGSHAVRMREDNTPVTVTPKL